jgi:hypothetical protein
LPADEFGDHAVIVDGRYKGVVNDHILQTCPDATQVQEVMTPLGHYAWVSADTPVLSLLEKVQSSDDDERLVLDGTEPTGQIRINWSLVKHPLFRLCLVALALELEEEALWLAVESGPAESWNALPRGRQMHAERQLKGKKWARDETNLLACTSFIDKGTILAKRRLLPIARRTVERVFREAEQVRNESVHPGGVGLLLESLGNSSP